MSRSWKLILEEPFRVFFPLGMLAGVHGVLLWQWHYAGWLPFNPIDAHARLLTQGFMGAFIAGFLGTSFPRLTGNRRWSGGEFLVLLGCWLLAVCHTGTGRVAAGDGWFAVFIALLLAGLVVRWARGRRDTPPPGFVLALAGVAGGGVAAACLAWKGGLWLGLEGVTWARLWLYQAFPLLPVMGVATYLLPRFFGLASSQDFDESPRPPAGWWPRVGSALFWGGHIVLGFALEVNGHPQLGQMLRGIVIMVWFLRESPFFRAAATPSTAGNVVRTAVIFLAAGWWCAAFLPQTRVGSLHLTLVGGLGLMVVIASARVIAGHAGRLELVRGKRPWLRWITFLALLAATTRMSADLLEKVRVSHHIYAAWTWVAVVLLWAAILGPLLFRADED